MAKDETVPQGVHLLYYCDTCNRRVPLAEGEGLWDGKKRQCAGCAASVPAAGPSQHKLKPATPSATGHKAAPRDSRRQSTISSAQTGAIPGQVRPKAIPIAISAGLLLLCTLALWLFLRSTSPITQRLSAAAPEQPVLPIEPPVTTKTPVPQPDPSIPLGQTTDPPVVDQPPGQPVTVPQQPPSLPTPGVETPTGPTPQERLALYQKDRESVAAMIEQERYNAADALLRKLKTDAASMPWWKEQESSWNEAQQRLQQLIQEGREESDAACEDAEKATTLEALANVERRWRPRKASAQTGELTAEWAKKVLDVVFSARRRLRTQLREKLTAQLEEKLTAMEKSLEAADRISEAQQRDVGAVESTVIQDLTLVEKYGERVAALRWTLDKTGKEELAPYHANLRKTGLGTEVSFDFSSPEQLTAWELDDPDKHGRRALLTPGPGLLLETKHLHEWAGKDRKKTPVLCLPFLVRSERWGAEVDAELVSGTDDKPFHACLMVWDGGLNFAALTLMDGGNKGWIPVLIGYLPKSGTLHTPATPLPAKAGESVRLQMACVGDVLACTVRFRSTQVPVSVGKERLGFQPKYVGLMVRTTADMTAVAHFRNFKLVGVPDTEKLKGVRESRKPAELKQIANELRLRNIAFERVAAGKALPLPLDPVANIACGNRLMEGRSDDERLILPYWGLLSVKGIPFQVVDPQGTTVKNAILLKGADAVPAEMPEPVTLTCGRAASRIHLLSGVSVGGFPGGEKGSLTLTLRIRYEDGTAEEWPFKNGEQFANYAQQVDVPGSQAGIVYQGHQVRIISIKPNRVETIKELEFVKGTDGCAPLILGVTIEPPRSEWVRASAAAAPLQIAIRHQSFTGGRGFRTPGRRGRDGRAIGAQPTEHRSMSAHFTVAEAPLEEALLELQTFRQNRAEGCLIDIFVNETRIFSGRDASPKRNTWNTVTYTVPPDALKDGTNTLRIDCTEPAGKEKEEPWFALDGATLRTKGSVDPDATGGTAGSFRYFRFTPAKSRDPGATDCQMSEFQFFWKNTWIPATIVTNPGGNTPRDQAAPNANDNNLGSKWYDLNRCPLIFDFGTKKAFDTYNWATGNDMPGRDPVRWKVEGSDDGASWTMVDDKTGADQPIPNGRSTWAAPGASRFTGWKLANGDGR